MEPLLSDCRIVLERFGAAGLIGAAADAPVLTPLGGGFSGALVMGVEWGEHREVLRRWPADAPSLARLRELHRWLAWLGDAGIPVAVPQRDATGATLVEFDGALWQWEPWLPGDPDRSLDVSPARLNAAMRTLARLHDRSSRYRPQPEGAEWFRTGLGPSPAIATRLELLREWSGPLGTDVRRGLASCPPSPLLQVSLEVLDLLRVAGDSVIRQLQACAAVKVPLFGCLRDVWSAHVLFTGDEATGLIDPAAARTESAAADLARLGASYDIVVPDRWQAAFRAYSEVRPLAAEERLLVDPLARSGLLLSALTWVRRLSRGEVSGDDPRVCERVTRLVQTLRGMLTDKLRLRS
jgi:Ser/Thr protein kinase RdoA (MazF antagonist)